MRLNAWRYRRPDKFRGCACLATSRLWLHGEGATHRTASHFYTPEQNGLVERFFRSLKEECVWQHNFASFAEASTAITQWIEWYNAERPHQALGYRSPRQFRALQPQLVA